MQIVQLHHACKSKIKAGMVSVREMEQNRMSFKSLIQNKKEERCRGPNFDG